MKKKTLYTLNVGDEEYEDMEGEENKDNTATTCLLYSEADRCPICLSCLLEKEIGFPESCTHVFCLTCILTWAEEGLSTLASCPIDRKPFQSVFKFSALEGCVKVQVKRQSRETKDRKNESSFKKQLSCQENSKSCMRKKVIREDLLSAKLYDLKMMCRISKNSEMGGKKNAVIKTNKPRRSNQCTDRCFRNVFSNLFSSSSHTGESSLNCTAYCTEFIEVNEIGALIRQKREELELSWFPDASPGVGRIGFIPWNIGTEVLPLISSVLPRTIFPTSTISLENFAGSEKQTRQAPKRKSVRRGRKLPLLKKKPRSSVPPPEKSSSSDSADEEVAGSDVPPVLETEHQSDGESSNTVQMNVENEPADGLRSCSEPLEGSAECPETQGTEERGESSYSESGTQDPPVLAGQEEEDQKVENTGIKANVLCLESEISKNISEKGGDPSENQDQIAGPSESEVKADTCTDPPPSDSTYSGSETEGHQPRSSLGELPENAQAVVSEEKVVERPVVEIIDPKDSTVITEQLVDSPKSESSEGGITHTVDREPAGSSEVHLLAHVEDEGAETTAACGTSGNEISNSIQDSENNLLKNNLNTKLDKSLEEMTESLVEHPRSTELPKTHVEQIQKRFGEDNNEMIPMECDSFCSDQNESEIEPSVTADAKQWNEKSVEHSFPKNRSSSDPANEKVETVSQPSESPLDTIDKVRKPRTRRSRFHSPSTTWSPSKDTAREKKRSQSPSPKRETGKDSRKSRSPSPKKEPARGRRKSRSQSPKKDNSNLKDQTNQQGDGSQLPINMMQPQMNVMQQQMNAQQHQPMNIFPYPVGVHAPLMNIQRSPFSIHPQLPLHLHTGVPLMQVAAPTSVSQGLPPPPPPPPPSQQVGYIASQPDGKQLQGIPSAPHVSNNMSTPVLPAPTAAPGNAGTVQGPSSGNTSSSSHSKASNAAVKLAESKVSVTVEASADSSKTDKASSKLRATYIILYMIKMKNNFLCKLQIQEKAAQEVKLAIKPFYQNKDITKEEYKEIVRKAVDKVCHSKSGEVNSTKVANLVKAYVDKYKYSRKGSQKKTLEEPVSTDKNLG
ncbi:Protein SCAF11 [Camelus dromedarius]|uniref:Protein SCAF11 n=1 Tax=Camelus dromedarius TaxID=9838 RepID=A0A5N4DHL7_CAMDR|nr:Protein SCAF11 [Camelus dromedarius]